MIDLYKNSFDEEPDSDGLFVYEKLSLGSIPSEQKQEALALIPRHQPRSGAHGGVRCQGFDEANFGAFISFVFFFPHHGQDSARRSRWLGGVGYFEQERMPRL